MGPNSGDRCPHKRRGVNWRCTEERPWKDKGRGRRDVSASQGWQQRQGLDEARKDSPSEPPGENAPAHILVSDFCPQTSREQTSVGWAPAAAGRSYAPLGRGRASPTPCHNPEGPLPTTPFALCPIPLFPIPTSPPSSRRDVWGEQ